MPANRSRSRAQSGEATSDVVWLRRPDAAAARRAEPLTLERIVVAAVAELDEHGAERLTMRRLAERLGVTSTALYWHVKTKEDLGDLVLDHIFGEVPIPAADVEPREAVRTMLSDWRAVMVSHPWSPTMLGRLLLGPNVLASTDFLQSALVRAGLSGIELASATSLLAEIVIGAAVTETTWSRVSPDDLVRAREYLSAHSEQYPTLSASGFVDRSQWSEADLFAFGLGKVVDALIPAGRPRRARRTTA